METMLESVQARGEARGEARDENYYVARLFAYVRVHSRSML